MFPALAIASATIGLTLLVYLIWGAVGDEQQPREKKALIAATALTIAVGAWQAFSHLMAASGGAH